MDTREGGRTQCEDSQQKEPKEINVFEKEPKEIDVFEKEHKEIDVFEKEHKEIDVFEKEHKENVFEKEHKEINFREKFFSKFRKLVTEKVFYYCQKRKCGNRYYVKYI